MKKKITIILIFQIILLSLVSISYAKYTKDYIGRARLSIAKPIARVEVKDDIYISNYGQKPVNFSIYNFDKNGKISEVKMNYKIMIKITQSNAPLKFKLYRIDGTNQTEINISKNNGVISQVESIAMNANSAETHNFKLEIEYDKTSNIELDENIQISISVQSIQGRV